MRREENPDLLREQMIRYLDCPCRYFAPMKDDRPLMEAFEEAKARGEREGFIPVIVVLDSILWECLLLNACPGGMGGEFIPKERDAYRQKALAAPLKDGRTVLEPYLKNSPAFAAAGNGTGQAMDRFIGYWDYFTQMTAPLLLAEIPVRNPWEVFAFLPFGGWNECPDTPELMAVAGHWSAEYGAVPAVITHDVLEFALPKPVPREAAAALAAEQYAFCADIFEQSSDPEELLNSMADSLSKSRCWYFWWD